MCEQFSLQACALRDVGLREAGDLEIFTKAGKIDAIVLTRDSDFVRLLEQHGAPPRVLWLTIGNSSNSRVREALIKSWPRITELFDQGEVLIEVQDCESVEEPRRL